MFIKAGCLVKLFELVTMRASLFNKEQANCTYPLPVHFILHFHEAKSTAEQRRVASTFVGYLTLFILFGFCYCVIFLFLKAS